MACARCLKCQRPTVREVQTLINCEHFLRQVGNAAHVQKSWAVGQGPGDQVCNYEVLNRSWKPVVEQV